MIHALFKRDILTIKDLSLSDIQTILETSKILKDQNPPLLKNKIIAHCFFEPSTRTRLSFESATHRLSGQAIGFSSDAGLSVQKGESLIDSIQVIDHYADLIVIRHPLEGAARLAAEVANVPVINAGDGANQHPTQALIDLFTIYESQKEIDGLNIALVGDLKYGRTIHSFAEACMLFDVRLYLVSPEQLSLPESLGDALKKRGIRFSFHQSLEDIIPKVDILYMTRIQQERFDSLKNAAIPPYVLTADLLKRAKKNLKVLHPLPRINEIDVSVDATPFAYYFQQAANGVTVRKALLALLLNEQKP